MEIASSKSFADEGSIVNVKIFSRLIRLFIPLLMICSQEEDTIMLTSSLIIPYLLIINK